MTCSFFTCFEEAVRTEDGAAALLSLAEGSQKCSSETWIKLSLGSERKKLAWTLCTISAKGMIHQDSGSVAWCHWEKPTALCATFLRTNPRKKKDPWDWPAASMSTAFEALSTLYWPRPYLAPRYSRDWASFRSWPSKHSCNEGDSYCLPIKVASRKCIGGLWISRWAISDRIDRGSFESSLKLGAGVLKSLCLRSQG